MAKAPLHLPTFTSPIEDWLLHVEGVLITTDATEKQKHQALATALPTDVAMQVNKVILS